MDFEKMTAELKALQTAYFEDYSESRLRELLTYQKQYIAALTAAQDNGDREAADYLFNGYMCIFLDENGDFLSDYITAAHAYDKNDAWKDDTYTGICRSIAYIAEGRADELDAMADFYRSAADEEDEDGSAEAVFALGYARKLADVAVEHKGDNRDRIAAIGKEFWDGCGEYTDCKFPDDIVTAYQYMASYSGNVGASFGICVAFEAEKALNQTETTLPALCRQLVLSAFNVQYDKEEDDSPSKLYWLAKMLLFAKKYPDTFAQQMRKEKNEYDDELNELIDRWVDVTAEIPNQQDFDLIQRACSTAAQYDVMGVAGVLACHFNLGRYPAEDAALCNIVLNNPFVAKKYPIYQNVANIILFKSNQISFDAFSDRIGAEMERIVQEKNEALFESIRFCLCYADLELLAQRFVFFFESRLPTEAVLVYAGRYFLNPVGDIKQDLERAYADFSKAAKMGNEEAKEKLSHFGRSLFGKLTYRQ